MAKSPEKVREDNRKRKQKQREKEAIRYSELGIEDIKFEILRGTRERLDQLKQNHGFEQDGEVFTLLIHSVFDCDMSQQSELLQTPPQKTA